MPGQYDILRKLAEGGMAEIFLARQRTIAGFERNVVLKRVLSELVTDSEFIESFLEEARLSAQLTHPNIVQIIELGEADGTYFIAMEYIQGVDLSTVLRTHRERGAPLPIGVALHIVCDMLAALGFAHDLADLDGKPLGLVHRDVSPSNAIVAFTGITKVVDFGIAKAMAKLEGRTKTGVIKGKLSYFAPEQLEKGVVVDRRIDLYAAAIVLYELLTLVHPFRGTDEIDTLRRIMHEPAADPCGLRSDLPRAIGDVVLKALAKDRDDRYGSAADLQRALEAAALQAGIALSHLEVRAYLAEILPDIEATPASPSQEKATKPLHVEPSKAEATEPHTPARSPALASRRAVEPSPSSLRDARVSGPDAPASKRPKAALARAVGLGLVVIAAAAALALVLRPSNVAPPESAPASAPATAPVITRAPRAPTIDLRTFVTDALATAKAAGFEPSATSPPLCTTAAWLGTDVRAGLKVQDELMILPIDDAVTFTLSVAWPAQVSLDAILHDDSNPKRKAVRIASVNVPRAGPVAITIPPHALHDGFVELTFRARRAGKNVKPVDLVAMVFVTPLRAPHAPAIDADGDCVRLADGDCNDADPAVHPYSKESCANNVDDDCNGVVDDCAK